MPGPNTTVPAASQIEVPETLLKKRKATDKAREERLAAALAARKVSILVFLFHFATSFVHRRYDDFLHVQLASFGYVA